MFLDIGILTNYQKPWKITEELIFKKDAAQKHAIFCILYTYFLEQLLLISEHRNTKYFQLTRILKQSSGGALKLFAEKHLCCRHRITSDLRQFQFSQFLTLKLALRASLKILQECFRMFQKDLETWLLLLPLRLEEEETLKHRCICRLSYGKVQYSNDHGRLQKCNFSVLDQKYTFWENLFKKSNLLVYVEIWCFC